MDLFIIKSKSELENIMKPDAPKNQTKVNELNSQLSMIRNQLDGLNKEKSKTTDQEQIKVINNVITNLTTQQDKLQNELFSVIPKPVDDMTYQSYVNTVEKKITNINTNSIPRGLSLTDFYNQMMSHFGDNAIGIWKNYLGKNLQDQYSMIFSRINQIIEKVYCDMVYDQNAIKVISDFYSKVKDYILLKRNLPQFINDNPPLKEEVDHLIYLINLILTPSTKKLITNTLNTYLKNANYLDDSKVNVNAANLDNFLTNQLPLRAIHYYGNIYDSSSDIDQNIISPEILFEPLTNYLKEFKQIGPDSSIYQDFTNTIIPFINNTYQNFITTVRSSTQAYERYLLQTYQLIQMLNLFVNPPNDLATKC